MKKYSIFLLASIFTLLFAACNQENELDAIPQERSNLVSISTQLPADFAKTRALPSIADHQLRCILEVWSKGNAASLILRKEQIGAAEEDNITFNFTLDTQGEYDCLMWADFVETGAAADANGKYPDKYYTTTDLKAIEVKEPAKLFNNEACDAFFGTGVLMKTEVAGTLGATLTRPFAKLTLKEADADIYATCTNVEVSYDVPTKFNIATSATSESKTATYSSVTKGNNVYFTSYILADANGSLGNINLTFTANGSQEAIEKIIPQGVPAKRNYRTNATGYLMGKKAEASTDASVKVEIKDEWLLPDEEDNVEAGDNPNALAVGDFYYSDGSYSHTHDAAKNCIGIVFAVGAQESDVIANYDGKITGKIKGYVLAVKDYEYSAKSDELYAAKTSKLNNSNIIPGTIPILFSTESTYNTTDFLGYKYTEELNAWNETLETVNQMQCIAHLNTFSSRNAAPQGTSGWYIPSAGQLTTILSNYYNNTVDQEKDLIIKTNLATLEASFEEGANTLDKAKGRLMTLPASDKSFAYLSSSIYQKDATTTAKVYNADFRPSENKLTSKTSNGTSHLRAVLTF